METPPTPALVARIAHARMVHLVSIESPQVYTWNHRDKANATFAKYISPWLRGQSAVVIKLACFEPLVTGPYGQ